jgi:hypothetical protein
MHFGIAASSWRRLSAFASDADLARAGSWGTKNLSFLFFFVSSPFPVHGWNNATVSRRFQASERASERATLIRLSSLRGHGLGSCTGSQGIGGCLSSTGTYSYLGKSFSRSKNKHSQDAFRTLSDGILEELHDNPRSKCPKSSQSQTKMLDAHQNETRYQAPTRCCSYQHEVSYLESLCLVDFCSSRANDFLDFLEASRHLCIIIIFTRVYQHSLLTKQSISCRSVTQPPSLPATFSLPSFLAMHDLHPRRALGAVLLVTEARLVRLVRLESLTDVALVWTNEAIRASRVV